jgi:hypothetical protein
MKCLVERSRSLVGNRALMVLDVGLTKDWEWRPSFRCIVHPQYDGSTIAGSGAR